MFQPDANEIIEDMSTTIGALYKENAILKSQLKAANRHIETADQKDAPLEGEVVEPKPKVA
jgi:hypothetical protein